MRGATIVEYALLVALMACICIPVFQKLGPKTAKPFCQVSAMLAASGNGYELNSRRLAEYHFDVEIGECVM
jgi:Flp pilus assembly pilin Flp